MSTQTLERPPEHPTRVGSRLGARFPGKYVSLTSFKRDGTGVATPVWFVVDGTLLLVITDLHSFKVRRIMRIPVVTVAPCSASGRLRSEPVPARAELLPDGERLVSSDSWPVSTGSTGS